MMEGADETIAADEIIVRVRTLGGRAFTVVADANTTVWQLKRHMQRAHGISKRDHVFLVGSDVAASAQTLAEFGSEGALEISMVSTAATCRYCGRRGRLKRCSTCDCYYCDVACQRADWRRHKRFDGCGWAAI